MFHFDAIENDRRIRDGLIAVSANKVIEFSKENTNLIAVFDDPFTKFSSGRIILFQEHVYNITGVPPIFIKGVPACIKIFFRLSIDGADHIERTYAALDSAESKDVYRSIGVSQVQYGYRIITPTP